MFVIDEVFKRIASMGQVSTDQFAAMQKNRDVVKAALHGARLKVEELQKVQDNILDIEAVMRRQQDDMNRFKDYTTSKKIDTVEMEDTPYHNTVCSTCNCVCHEQCGLEEIQIAGDCRFLQCVAFSGQQHCNACGGESRCGHSSHYHARKKPVKKSKTVDDVLEDVKRNYEAATAGFTQSQTDLSNLQSTKKLLEDSISQISNEILVSCKDIKSICKGFDFAEEMHILLQQLEAHKLQLHDPVAKKTAQAFIDSIIGIITGLNAESAQLLEPVVGE
jgi:hypothetical protein